MLKTDKVELRPIDISDTENILNWRNSNAVSQNFFLKNITREGHLNWLDTKIKNKEAYQFIIVDSQNQKDIGTVYLRDIDSVHKKAEFGIYIGETAFRGRGLGTQATELICDFGFKTLNLQRIFLRVFESNEAAINTYANCGFQIEGVLRNEIYANGKYNNVVIMGRII